MHFECVLLSPSSAAVWLDRARSPRRTGRLPDNGSESRSRRMGSSCWDGQRLTPSMTEPTGHLHVAQVVTRLCQAFGIATPATPSTRREQVVQRSIPMHLSAIMIRKEFGEHPTSDRSSVSLYLHIPQPGIFRPHLAVGVTRRKVSNVRGLARASSHPLSARAS